MSRKLFGWRFENSYAQLPGVFYQRTVPEKVREAKLVILNHALAEELGLVLTGAAEDDLAGLFAGQVIPDGAEPIAQAYAGHQYGGFTMLGDGRAILLGEHRARDGQLVDIQFKGSGQTMFSRRGDGKAALGPMLREYIISEAMHAMGIPTTRSLAVVTTGEPVYRERTLPGAILTRVAASHIRVGTFQFLAARQDLDNLRILADYTIQRHYPEVSEADNPYFELLRQVMARQAALIARWQSIGFVHGVMNTDNMAISGETIDFGPCAFMDTYHPDTVFSSIDHGGRYAYANQPNIAQWNLARFAETLLPFIASDPQQAVDIATEAIRSFPTMFENHWLEAMCKKIGLDQPQPSDNILIDDLLSWMQDTQADFTNTFDDLTLGATTADDRYTDARFQTWLTRWQLRLSEEARTPESARQVMLTANPAFIPRNHRVEEALQAASDHQDLNLVHRLLDVVTQPFDRRQVLSEYRQPAPQGSCRYKTFCGT